MSNLMGFRFVLKGQYGVHNKLNGKCEMLLHTSA